jgi:predicted  nucleic acid-binding Zn-ribbon protein
MLAVIEHLLALQEHDRKQLELKDQLAHIPAERAQLQTKAGTTQNRLDLTKNRLKHLESERKRLELEADGKKTLIEKYSLQQFQTKKNEEYRALAHEIEACKQAIRTLEDQQLDIMEQAEGVQKEVQAASGEAKETQKNVDDILKALAQREQALKEELSGMEAHRGALASAVDESTRSRYERLFKNKGESVIVGIQHGVCGGCHMRLSRQIVVSCQAEQEIVTCTQCGRILYYTPDMDVAVTE